LKRRTREAARFPESIEKTLWKYKKQKEQDSMKRFVMRIALVLAFCLVAGALLGHITSSTASAASLKTTTATVAQINPTSCGPAGNHGPMEFFFNTDVTCFTNSGYIPTNGDAEGIFTGVYVICSRDNQAIVTLNRAPYLLLFDRQSCQEVDPHAWITVIRIS
jgi:hypothetical protein